MYCLCDVRYMAWKTSMVVPHRHPWIVVWYDADLWKDGRGSSARADTNLLRIWVENGRSQKANFVLNNAEGSRNTSQESFELSL